jgi:protein-arginine kinase activator protein McsA
MKIKITKLKRACTCYECGKNFNEYKWSKFFCIECDEKRVKHITEQLSKLIKELPGGVPD